ncbi:MAG: DUF1837 domain-containing protein [Proteobacteria bacterium]|nr:DUF1837 domain-containing protein [Pseudomonadota bacterium]
MTEIVSNCEDEDISDWFEEHILPDGAIDASVYIVPKDKRQLVADYLVSKIPDCYISQQTINTQMQRTGLSKTEVIQNKLPDAGNVMSGDFGEILTLFFLGSYEEEQLKKIQKWRFKQDRLKAAPHSDVILLNCPKLASPSENDFVICAESKAKATRSTKYRPIANAIEGYNADKTGRLARTLAWLREKAIEDDIGTDIAYIERFTIHATAKTFQKKYKAFAIIDYNFLDEELLHELELPQQNPEFELLAIGINDLKALYEECFSRAISEA